MLGPGTGHQSRFLPVFYSISNGKAIQGIARPWPRPRRVDANNNKKATTVRQFLPMRLEVVWSLLPPKQRAVQSNPNSMCKLILPEIMKMCDYLVFDFPFQRTILGLFEFRTVLCRAVVVRVVGFRYLNLIFGALFVTGSNFDFCY